MEPKDLRYHNPTHYGVILHTLTRQGGTINDRHKLQTRYAQHLQISPHTIKNRSTELIDLGLREAEEVHPALDGISDCLPCHFIFFSHSPGLCQRTPAKSRTIQRTPEAGRSETWMELLSCKSICLGDWSSSSNLLLGRCGVCWGSLEFCGMIFNRFALVALRELQLMSKSELAVAAQLSPAYITELENGTKCAPSEKVIRSLAAALQIDARALYIRHAGALEGAA